MRLSGRYLHARDPTARDGPCRWVGIFALGLPFISSTCIPTEFFPAVYSHCPALCVSPTGCRKNDGQPRERGAVRAEAAGAASAAEKREVETIASSLRAALNALPDYNVLMSLADWKYSGMHACNDKDRCN